MKHVSVPILEYRLLWATTCLNILAFGIRIATWTLLPCLLASTALGDHPAVCRVVAREPGNIASLGSGVLVEPTLIVTNEHVVRDGTRGVSVVFAGVEPIKVTVVKVDADFDLAALRLAEALDKAKPVALAPRMPRRGDRRTLCGYGPGPYRQASGPFVQYLQPEGRVEWDYIEMRATARQGDSGGAMFNERGELAGVTWGSSDGYASGVGASRVGAFLQEVPK